jgi:predicted ATPase/class 3 adenylate cyclase
MPALPSGTVTFLFTDIEGSSRLWEQDPEAMRVALARHDALLRAAIAQQDGIVFKTIGDAFCAVFHAAPDALRTALAAQRALCAESWPAPAVIRVRMALHTGAAETGNNDYFGPPLNRLSRLLAAGHGGQVLLSAATQELVRDALPPDSALLCLGEHRLRDLSRPETVFQLLHPALAAEFPPLRSLSDPALPNNLPLQLTSFIGREKAMEEVKRLLKQTRLLTLTGSGGCGKTRLSLQVAADILEDYPEGVWQVELAPLADPALVPQTVAKTLGIQEQAGQTFLQTLTESLQSRRLLILLDNCEHLIATCAQLTADLLRSCPQIAVLATSREPLGIGGEQTYGVPSLSQPDPKQALSSEMLSQYESVCLFLERARLVRPDFAVTDSNAAALAQVCYHLDGIPLAIELAAARVRALPVEDINTRLDNRFRLLTGGSRAALPRQQTLRALIDWSYDLLGEQERLLLSRLSVFAGGWTLAAAEQVCAGESAAAESIEEWEVLDLLTGLVDKSLVVVETQSDASRYRFLETVRQYARDRLTESGESAAVRARHRDSFLTLVVELKAKLQGAEQGHWLAVLEEEHDNLRQALTFCLEEPAGGEAGLLLGAGLQKFWWTHGHLSEGSERLRAALAHPAAQKRTRTRADALHGASILAWMQGDYLLARSLEEESLTIRREQGDRRGVAIALGTLGIVASEQGDNVSARSLEEESLAIYRELGDRHGIATSLNNLGNRAGEQGDYLLARSLYEESLAIRREVGDRYGIASSLNNLGNIAMKQGEDATARSLTEESLAIRREVGDRRGIAGSLETIASLVVRAQRGEQAARLWGAAEALREAIGSPRPAREREEYAEQVAVARAALGDAAFAAAWEAGRALPWEQAVAYALETRNAP